MTAKEAIKALTAWHMAQVGYVEKKNGNVNYLYDKTANAGSSNYTKYGYEMNRIQPSNMDYPAPWCDAYFDNGMVNVFGVDIARALIHDFEDYTVKSAKLYKKHGEWTTVNPREGYQIFFRDSSGICHTGYVYANDGVYVYTVEGNTSVSDGVVANGGGVAKKRYLLGDTRIAGYGMPNYIGMFGTEELTVTQYEELKEKIKNLTPMIYNYIDDNMPAWARPTIQKLKDNGILKGDEKGKLDLTDDMLRILVMLDRQGVFN